MNWAVTAPCEGDQDTAALTTKKVLGYEVDGMKKGGDGYGQRIFFLVFKTDKEVTVPPNAFDRTKFVKFMEDNSLKKADAWTYLIMQGRKSTFMLRIFQFTRALNRLVFCTKSKNSVPIFWKLSFKN